jgi:hypothetical protein
MHQAALLLTLLAPGILGGCGLSKQVSVSLTDRCAHIMQAAMPFADLDVGDKTSHSPDIRTIIATVRASRTDTPPGSAIERDLAAECTFTDNVLTAFRWTKGGPQARP